MDELAKTAEYSSFFAIEGAAFVGKTTLLNHLSKEYSDRVVVIPEAGEYVGGDKNFPDDPFGNMERAKAAVHFFITIEQRRCLDAIRLHQQTGLPVIFDRATPVSSLFLYSLLAHVEPTKAEFFAELHAYALACFGVEISLGKIFVPRNLIYVRVADQETFEKRLSRGTRNVVFSNWDSFVYLNNKYEQLIENRYRDNNLVLTSANNKENITDITRVAVNFVEFVKRPQEMPLDILGAFSIKGDDGNPVDPPHEADKYDYAVKNANRLMDEVVAVGDSSLT